jgi:hypothetical protein
MDANPKAMEAAVKLLGTRYFSGVCTVTLPAQKGPFFLRISANLSGHTGSIEFDSKERLRGWP